MVKSEKKVNTRGADIALKTEKLLKQLIHVMGQENLALQSYNRAMAEEMAQEKTLLIGNYRVLMKDLEKDPQAFKNMASDIRKPLEQLIADFETAMKENAKTVYAKRYAVKRLLDRILTKARDAAGTTVKSYNASGKMNSKTSRAGLLPTQLNETY
jgi:hypothetical protein